MGKSAEQSKLIIDHFKILWWEKIEGKNGKTKLGHSESFFTTLVGKYGTSAKWSKLSILNDVMPLW